MAAADLAAADGVAAALTWLQRHPRVLAHVDGDAGRVGPYNRPPYPRLRVLAETGDDRNLRWLRVAGVRLEAVGDSDGSPGDKALHDLLYNALAALTELPDEPVGPGEAVVTYVESGGGGGRSPLPNGQPRWLATVRLHIHPPHQ